MLCLSIDNSEGVQIGTKCKRRLDRGKESECSKAAEKAEQGHAIT
jgi:hypothetical protein